MSTEEKTYLELSEAGEGAHKFYEVTVAGKKVTIRYGRIGDAGQSSTKSYASEKAAKADADKKLQEKRRKGYADAVMGARKKRAVTRRTVDSRPSTAKQAPVVWKFNSGDIALGIFVDDRHCWVGNQQGKVCCLDHEAQVLMQFKLPEGVKALVGDGAWIYAGCDDGNVYDLSGKVPRLAYEIAEDVDILWVDIWSGILAVSDSAGQVTLVDPEGQQLWAHDSPGFSGWMVRLDADGVYHGHSSGVTAYDLNTGKSLWYNTRPQSVLFGWQTAGDVYPGCGTSKVFRLDKKKGKEEAVYECDRGAGVVSNASSPDGKYVFAGDGRSSVYCFDAGGKRLWKLGTGCGSALSMQFHNDRIYVVTTDGYLACLDASEKAIQAAQAGTVPQAREVKAPKAQAVAPTAQVETTADAGQGVVVECVQEGSQLRVHVVSAGYKKDWYVQFPRDIREAGARYVVEEVQEAAKGGFYRARGEIKKLAPGAAAGKKKKK